MSSDGQFQLTQPPQPGPIVSVGGVVLRDAALLVARMTYSPTAGQYSLPGGVVDNGESLAAAAAREVLEETGVTAAPLGSLGVASLLHRGVSHCYHLWLLTYVAGEPRADGVEIDDCGFIPLEALVERQDAAYLVRYLAKRLAAGDFEARPRADDFAPDLLAHDLSAWELFM